MDESVERQDTPQSGGEPNVTEGRDRKRRRRLIALLSLLGVFLVMACVVGYYMFTKKSIVTLPAVQAVTRNVPPTYLFSIYDVNGPMGVAVSPNGQSIYVTEGGGERQIKSFDRTGRQVGSFSPPDSTPSTRNPLYIAVDKQGKLYVTDKIRLSVAIFTPDGKFVGDFTSGGKKPEWIPLGITLDSAGNLLVTDITQDKHQVFEFDPQGKQKLQFGKMGAGPGEFSYPNALVVDRQGRIIVSNGNNGRIDVFNAVSGNQIASFGSGSGVGTVGLPRGVAIDDMDRLYVVDTAAHQILVYDLRSAKFDYLFSFGKEGMDDGEFNYPNAIAIDLTGRIYIADRANNRVQVWGY